MRNLRPLALASLALTVCLTFGSTSFAVVINEIHYNPVESPNHEFVEIFNPGAQAVDLSGWRLRSGIEFDFPEGTTIHPRGFLVVSHDRDAVAEAFGISRHVLLGNFRGSLDNGTEKIALVDARGVLVDEVRYDDESPWSSSADGLGGSLERICATADSSLASNWSSNAETGPTPNRANHSVSCPLPEPATPRVTINEIFYHPPGRGEEDLEFVELANTTDAPISLRGWFFLDGFTFIFDDDASIPANGYLAVARNAEAVKEEFGVENVVGDYVGQLSNSGERLTLVDGNGEVVDSVRYRDGGDWPMVADGFGISLEKMNETAPSDFAGSWNEAQPVRPEGTTSVGASGYATSDRLLIYNGGPGEFLIDNISLRRTDQPDVEILPNGTFDENVDGWEIRGSHETSFWEADPDSKEGGVLHLVSTGRGTGRTQGISFDVEEGLDRDRDLTYELKVDFRHLAGEAKLTFRISGASPTRGVYWSQAAGSTASPGLRNGNHSEVIPPFVDAFNRFPREPRSTDPVFITTRVQGGSVGTVTLQLQVIGGDEEQELALADDGLAGDGEAGDGIWGVELPPQPHASQVTYRIVAGSEERTTTRTFPPDSATVRSRAYYVNDEQPDTDLPVYTVLFRPESGANPKTLIANLNCTNYQPCNFAYKGDLRLGVGIRRRGQSVCGDPDVIKKFLKVKFPQGHDFRGVRKINLQSLWTDKSLIREHMSWKTFAGVGNPHCYHRYFRMQVNGQYFGLYAELEHGGTRNLPRTNPNDDGNLYKATASREERTGTYEKKTNEDDPSMTDLRAFLNELHGTNGSANLVNFFKEKTNEDGIIEYQLGQVLTNNRDYPHKNHYLYHDTDTGKWMPTTWDMDLTYGKRWDGNFEGVLNDLMDNPGTNPWHTTRVGGGGTGNHLLDRFFMNAGTYYQRAYVVRLWSVLQEKYRQDIFEDRIQKLRTKLFFEQQDDIRSWGRSRPSANDRNAPAAFDPNLDRVRTHVRLRRTYLLNYLRDRHRFTGHPRLKITELMYNPPGALDEGEFIELRNNSEAAIDISGWTVVGTGFTQEDGTRNDFVFPDETTLEDNEIIILAKDPEVFRDQHRGQVAVETRVFGPYAGRLANNGEDLRVRDAGTGHPATVDWLRYGTDGDWPQQADGLGFSVELTDVSPNRDNDFGDHWTLSAERGGTPGRIVGVNFQPELFSRGDCLADGRVNISDAVALLLHLFAGGEIACEDACDFDGSAQLNLTDAVFLLEFLFGGGDVPIPFPGPGECAEASANCGESNCEVGA